VTGVLHALSKIKIYNVIIISLVSIDFVTFGLLEMGVYGISYPCREEEPGFIIASPVTVPPQNLLLLSQEFITGLN
jgi:hypothetical protein